MALTMWREEGPLLLREDGDGLSLARRESARAPAAAPEAAPAFDACVVAIVGCDGSGKTTLVRDLVAVLSRIRPTERRYMGLISGETGDRIKTLPVIGTWLERRLAAKVRRAQDMKKRLPGPITAVVMYLFSVWRTGQLRKLRTLAGTGVLVIADRFPQAEVPGFHYDGPGLSVERSENRLVRALARAEQRLYEAMAADPPTLIIRLLVDADTAYARKPDHPYAELRDKIAVMAGLRYGRAHVVEIDTRQPYPDVLADAVGHVLAVAGRA